MDNVSVFPRQTEPLSSNLSCVLMMVDQALKTAIHPVLLGSAILTALHTQKLSNFSSDSH